MIYQLDTNTKCNCGRNATLHKLVVQYGKSTEIHQCDSCAAKADDVARNWENFKPGDMK